MTSATTMTGTCPACFRTMALDGSKITRHGWNEQGQRRVGQYGNAWHSGACFGVGWAPFEVSPEGTVAFITQVIWPDSLLAANEVARYEGRPSLVVALQASRVWNGETRRYEAPAPVMVAVAPGDVRRAVEVHGQTLFVAAYEAELEHQLRIARHHEEEVRRAGVQLSAKVEAWTPAALVAARGPVVHFAAKRGVYCSPKTHGSTTENAALVTCARCAKGLAADAAARAVRDAEEADAQTLAAWLRAQPAPAPASEIKKALGWDTKRTNRAIDRATRGRKQEGSDRLLFLVVSVYRPGKPEAWAPAVVS